MKSFSVIVCKCWLSVYIHYIETHFRMLRNEVFFVPLFLKRAMGFKRKSYNLCPLK